MSTHLKLFSGDSTIMQQFYIDVGGERLSDNDGGVDGSSSGITCVVCQESPVTRAMLPCRHACVCAGCFVRLRDRCPMCRSQVKSFILIGDEDNDTNAFEAAGRAAASSGPRQRVGVLAAAIRLLAGGQDE